MRWLVLGLSGLMFLGSPGCTRKEGSPVDLGKRPLLEGLGELRFGASLEAVKNDPALRKRCQDEMHFSKAEPRHPGQRIEEWGGYCIAELAGRYVEMGIQFDHQNRLHLIFFMFGHALSDQRVKKLATDEERQAFAREIRTFLDPGLGQPEDRSGKASSGPAIKLSWYGKTADQPAHATEVNLDLDPANQTISWEDITRYQALEAALEGERSGNVEKQGI